MIRKRDGSLQKFNLQKIVDAVILSGASEAIADYVADYVKQAFIPEMSVFEIEQLVEELLLENDTKAAHEYISYRARRAAHREMQSSLFRDINGIINKTNEAVLKENGNTDSGTLPAQRDLTAGEIAKAFAKHILPADVMEAHNKGTLHYHDMTFAPMNKWTNCCLVDVKGMLSQGFTLGGADIESPKSASVCASVVSQIIAQISSHQYGGTSVANIDQIIEPYAFMSYEKHLATARAYQIPMPETYAKDLTKKEIYDAMQALEYEINSLFNSHAQSPFTTISFGQTTSWVGQSIQEAILRIRMKGLGKNGVTAIFPKLVMIYDDEINGKPGSPNYWLKQLAVKCSSERMYPDWLSAKNNKSITGAYKPITSMGCRAFLSACKDEDGNEIIDGRNNLGVVTINVPQCALKADTEEDFWENLEHSAELAHKALQTRIAYLSDATADLAPPLYMEGGFGMRLNPKDKVLPKMIARGCSISLGFIGLHETYNALFGVGEDLEDRQAFSIEITKFLRSKVDKWRKEEGIGYSLYATPSESLCHRLLKLDRKNFGLVEGVTDKEYYTNSFHLDVLDKVDPFTKIDFEAPFHWISSGGHISYVEFPDMRNNLEGLEKVIDYAMDKLDYFGVNTPADTCLDCKAEMESKHTAKGYVCSKCDSTNVLAIRRICGYLGPINQRPVNAGKAQEFTLRVKHC